MMVQRVLSFWYGALFRGELLNFRGFLMIVSNKSSVFFVPLSGGAQKRSFNGTLQGTNISPKNGILKMIFLFPRWDMLIPWRVFLTGYSLRLVVFRNLKQTTNQLHPHEAPNDADGVPWRSVFFTAGFGYVVINRMVYRCPNLSRMK